MNAIIAIPLELRLILLFLIGAMLGSLVNLIVDRLREETPRSSPWNAFIDRLLGRQAPPPKRAPTPPAVQRKLRGRKAPRAAERREPGKFALLPIVGWLEIAATAPPDQPRRFWLRPMLVELLFAAAVALLYWWEVGRFALVPADLSGAGLQFRLSLGYAIHQQFALHVLLLFFMAAASLIDMDEWVIPDSIAVTGTLVALGFAVAFPASALFATAVDLDRDILLLRQLHFWSPAGPIEALAPGSTPGLALALACIWLWCFAQLPRVWTIRWGWKRAWQLFFRRLARESNDTLRVVTIGVALSMVAAIAWSYGEERWTALLTALVGLTVGSGIVWIIRIIGSAILQREAMGFGDVTLMAMIGAFLGWQPTVCAFFLSPLFGLIPPLMALLLRLRTPWEVPYGPFLCMGAGAVLLLWARLWPRLAEALDVFIWLGPGFAVSVLGGALVLLVGLLFGAKILRRALT